MVHAGRGGDGVRRSACETRQRRAVLRAPAGPARLHAARSPDALQVRMNNFTYLNISGKNSASQVHAGKIKDNEYIHVIQWYKMEQYDRKIK